MIRVYDSNEKLFNNNGIKILRPLSADLTKKDNGDYYIEVKDTLDNIDYYQSGLILRVDTPFGVQGFRCGNPKVKDGNISCKAWHLSYDAKNYIIDDSYAVDMNCNDALDKFNQATDITSPFTTISDITKLVSSRIITQSLFDVYTLFISEDRYGGHWFRDNWTLGIKSTIGEDRGVVLAPEKNITGISVEEDWSDVCTKVLPYTTDGEARIYIDGKYAEIDDLYDIPYTKVVKFDNVYKKEDFDDYDAFVAETKTWLEAEARSYLAENKLPKVNYSVEASIDNVSDVGDVIHVKHPKCRVNITTNVIAVEYDLIRNCYTKIQFGNFKPEIKNLSQQITAKAEETAKEAVKQSTVLLENELEQATASFNSMMNASYKIIEEDKIMFVDKLPKEEATYVLKISNGGIGFSSTGINGTFTSAWTLDGTLNMGAINVINLTASLIKGGTLRLGGVNNSSGTFELYDEANRLVVLQDKEGITVYAANGDYVKLNADVGFAGYNKSNVKVYWADGDVFHMKNAEIEGVTKFANKIKLVPVETALNTGIGFVAVP